MRIIIPMILSAVLLVTCGEKTTLAPVSLSTHADSVSYSTGYLIGSNYQPALSEINTDALVRGVLDGLQNEEGLIDEATCNRLFVEMRNIMNQKMREARDVKRDENKVTGEAFLAENRAKEGVIERESGLQYKIIREGTGASPGRTDRIVAHYRGRLIDGTVFDSSYDRGEPLDIKVSQVIKGWIEALQLMREGAKWELYVPSELAYGDQGAGQTIPPGATLIFEIELIEVK